MRSVLKGLIYFPIVLFLLLTNLCIPLVRGQQISGILYEEYIPITTDDGITLASSLVRPDVLGTFPTIIMRTPYGRQNTDKGVLINFARQGYAFLIQDCRGRFGSDGVFEPFLYAKGDGEATLRWVRSQPWSNGRIGAIGNSYDGFTALSLVAGSGEPPDVVYIRHPVASPAGGLYHGGAIHFNFDYHWSLVVNSKSMDIKNIERIDWQRLLFQLPIINLDTKAGRRVPHWRKWVRWANGDFGREALPEIADIKAGKTAFYFVAGWFDPFCNDVINLFKKLNPDGKNRKIKIIIGPYDHGASHPPNPDISFGGVPLPELSEIKNRWLDRWLLKIENLIETRPTVEYYLLGENRWISCATWPPKNMSELSYFLHSDGNANTMSGDGRLDLKSPENELTDTFIYNPANPVPTHGGACWPINADPGPKDHTRIEKRLDVLVYTTKPLEKNLTIAGPVKLELYVTTSVKDTDFTGKLVDVYPDGKPVSVTDGIIRVRFSGGLGKPVFTEPGTIISLKINLGHTAITFPTGHSIRLEISSSNFPRFDRNLNTGGTIGIETTFKRAAQTVYHDNLRASRLILPVLK